jgi:hypothetical protein
MDAGWRSRARQCERARGDFGIRVSAYAACSRRPDRSRHRRSGRSRGSWHTHWCGSRAALCSRLGRWRVGGAGAWNLRDLRTSRSRNGTSSGGFFLFFLARRRRLWPAHKPLIHALPSPNRARALLWWSGRRIGSVRYRGALPGPSLRTGDERIIPQVRRRRRRDHRREAIGTCRNRPCQPPPWVYHA